MTRTEYLRGWRAANPEKAKRTPEQQARHHARFKHRYATDPEFRAIFLARQKRYSKTHPKMTTAINLKRKYGLTPATVEEMLAKQDNKCAICGDGPSPTTKAHFPHVDHCHATKKVRGLLCRKCNHALGLFKDDPAILRAAADYLEKSRNS